MTNGSSHIKLITDDTLVHKKTMLAINNAVRNNKPFALGYQEGSDKGAMIFNPANLSAVHTDGGVFTYSNWENFSDAVRLTLIAYPLFIDCGKMLPKSKPDIKIVDR